MFADDTTIPLPAMYISDDDPAVTFTDGRVKAGRLWLDTSTGTIGTLKKRNAANDGWDSLINLDGATPAAHATSHQNGGSDEISVAGLSGVLGDAQVADKVKESSGPTTLVVGAVADGEILKRSGGSIVGAASTAPAAHATEHEDGGSDELDVTGLSGVLGDPQIAGAVVESGGPTLLVVGSVGDGQVLQRSGSSIIGADAGGGGTDVITAQVFM